MFENGFSVTEQSLEFKEIVLKTDANNMERRYERDGTNVLAVQSVSSRGKNLQPQTPNLRAWFQPCHQHIGIGVGGSDSALQVIGSP